MPVRPRVVSVFFSIQESCGALLPELEFPDRYAESDDDGSPSSRVCRIGDVCVCNKPLENAAFATVSGSGDFSKTAAVMVDVAVISNEMVGMSSRLGFGSRVAR